MAEVLSFDQLDISKRYTYADYLTWWFDERVELIRGKVHKMSPAPSSDHQRVSGVLQYHLYGYLRQHQCKVFAAPFDVRLNKSAKEEITTVVQPDLCVVCDVQKIDQRGCKGAPDLIVEILSPSSSTMDLNTKYKLYQENGVKEYWIVYPGEAVIDCFELVGEAYTLREKLTRDQTLNSIVLPDFSLALSEVFESPYQ
ncbi:MAG: Uma2 family endonuclease [Cyclobacteriaceae bacterium]